MSEAVQQKDETPPADIPPGVKEAETAFREGRLDEALEACQQVLAQDPVQPDALNITGLIHLRRSDVQGALQSFQTGTQAHPANAGLHANMGRLLLDLNKPVEAAYVLMTAVLNRPDVANYKSLFANALRNFQCTAFNADFKRAAILCLEDGRVSYNHLSNAVLSLLRVDPATASIMALSACETYEEFLEKVDIEALKEGLSERIIHLSLWRLLFPYMESERLFSHLRRYALENQDRMCTETFFPFLCSLGLHCFFNEYVFLIEKDEETKMQALEQDLQEASPDHIETQARFALLSCYRSLLGVSQEDALIAQAEQSEEPLFKALIKTQVAEPREEQEIRGTIACLIPPEDEVSQAVRAQYEENPYPRWSNINAFTITPEIRSLAQNKEILIAGCGTGQEAMDIAQHFPEARVTAIDLSLSSLSYAIRKAREIGQDNLEFMQADILDLDQMGKSFDLVISSGVLHHMKDPVAGFKSLLRQLKPNGVLKIALYSTIARKGFAACQDWIKEEGWLPTPEGIRTFRRAVLELPPRDPRRAVLNIRDFFSMSQCRDVVFHVQEHTFTLPELKALFADLELDVFKFIMGNRLYEAAYRQMFPDHGARASLDSWHAFEQEHPDAFASMYNMMLTRTAERDTRDVNWILKAVKY